MIPLALRTRCRDLALDLEAHLAESQHHDAESVAVTQLVAHLEAVAGISPAPTVEDLRESIPPMRGEDYSR